MVENVLLTGEEAYILSKRNIERTLSSKLDINQGIENAGKLMVVGENGIIVPSGEQSGSVEIDETLNIAGAAADAKAAGDALRRKTDSSALDRQANRVDVLYKLANGQLYETAVYQRDGLSNVVYPGSIAAEINRISGSTVVWNQQINPDDYDSKTSTGIQFEKGMGTSVTISGTAASNSFINLDNSKTVNYTAGHKYYIDGIIGGNPNNPHLILNADGKDIKVFYSPTIFTADEYSKYAYLRLQIPSGWRATDKKTYTIICVDLTQMFGPGGEPSDVNDSVIAGIEDYYAKHPGYNAGSLLHAAVKEVVAKNEDGDVVDTLQIPDAVQNLDLYGAGIEAARNTIIASTDRAIYARAVKMLRLADLDWKQSDSKDRYFAGIEDMVMCYDGELSILSEKYISYPAMWGGDDVEDGAIWQDSVWMPTIPPEPQKIWIRDSTVSNVDELKEKLGDAKAVYRCENESIDITDIWDPGILKLDRATAVEFVVDGSEMHTFANHSIVYLINLSEAI